MDPGEYAVLTSKLDGLAEEHARNLRPGFETELVDDKNLAFRLAVNCQPYGEHINYVRALNDTLAVIANQHGLSHSRVIPRIKMEADFVPEFLFEE